MQHEVVKKQPLLNDKGRIIEPGWARNLVWKYDRKAIHAPVWRIKEWDYYLVTGQRYAAAFTISDLGYAGLISVSLIDLVAGKEHTETVLTPFPMGRLKLGKHSDDGYAEFRNQRVHLRYRVKPGLRKIQCKFLNFKEGKTLEADLLMQQPPMDSICIATPWEKKPTAFYYNQKINCMPVKGTIKLADQMIQFDSRTDMAVLDWGRGVWTYDNIWYWGTCSTRIGGHAFGFNLGYGFSDRSSASENVIFYDGHAHKLTNVKFDIPVLPDGQYDFMQPWNIISEDGRFEAIFIPILDRKAKIDLKLICSDQHQVFGYLTGTAILDDGQEIKMRELIAAIEVIHNRY